MTRTIRQKPLRRLASSTAIPRATGAAVRSVEDKVEETDTRITEVEKLPGSLIRRQTFTSTGIFTPHRDAKSLRVRMVGGGGGGGGSIGGAGWSVGAGGSSGWYLEFTLTPTIALRGGVVVIGAGGVGGVAANGGDGGDTTLMVNGTTYIAKGGRAGITVANTAGVNWSDCTALSVGSTPSTVMVANVGGALWKMPNAVGGPVFPGVGGGTPLGGGGCHGIINSPFGNGSAGNGNGGGGGGSFSSTGNGTGGTGSPGLVLIEEYR